MNTFVLYAEVNAICIAVIVIIAVTSYSHLERKDRKKRCFLHSASLIALAGLFDCLWNLGLIGVIPASLALLKVLNLLYFSCFGLSTFFWFLFAEATAKSRLFESRRRLFVAAIPLLILFALLIRSLFSDLLFNYDEVTGNYRPHMLYYIQHALCSFYILLATARSLVFAAKTTHFARRRECITVASFAVPPLFCGILKIFLPHAPLVTPGIVLSFLMVYIHSLGEQNARDAVTGLKNRRAFLKSLEEQLGTIRKNERLYLLFLDIDSFKTINDRFGHAEGDRALCIVASSLRRVSRQTGGYCARYGGDEFVFLQILGKDDDINRIGALIAEVVRQETVEAALPYPIRMSVGYSEYRKGDDIGDLIENADNDMYRHKFHSDFRSASE